MHEKNFKRAKLFNLRDFHPVHSRVLITTLSLWSRPIIYLGLVSTPCISGHHKVFDTLFALIWTCCRPRIEHVRKSETLFSQGLISSVFLSCHPFWWKEQVKWEGPRSQRMWLENMGVRTWYPWISCQTCYQLSHAAPHFALLCSWTDSAFFFPYMHRIVSSRSTMSFVFLTWWRLVVVLFQWCLEKLLINAHKIIYYTATVSCLFSLSNILNSATVWIYMYLKKWYSN
jgi:hypothetical protein